MNNNKNEIFTAEKKSEMQDIFNKMEKHLLLKLYLDKRDVSKELEIYMREMSDLTDKIEIEVVNREAGSDTAPCTEICFEDGSPTGLAFHGVPAGHELSSFMLGLYNVAGPGQPLDENTKKRIASLKTPLDMKVLVTLSCSMCPDLVSAAQHIAAENSAVTAHIYDIMHFDKLRDKYNVMSVPCLVVNNEKISFGRKNLRELLEFIEK